jgi:hypothetical protein
MRYCGFCGKELPSIHPPAAPIRTPFGDLESRFAAMEAHPSMEGVLAHVPGTRGIAAGHTALGVFGIVFSVIALGMFMFTLMIFGPFAVFPLIFIVVGVLVAMSGFKKSAKFQSSPLERVKAVVVDERVRISGGGRNSSSRTHYFATLQDKENNRQEYMVDEATASTIAPGDIGVAFIKASYMLDFRRIEV